MKKYCLFILLAFALNYSTAQNISNEDVTHLKREITTLHQQFGIQKSLVDSQQKKITSLQSELVKCQVTIDSLQLQINNLTHALSLAKENLDADINKANQSIEENTTSLKEAISTKSIIGIMIVLIVVILLLCCLYFLRKKISKSESAIDVVKVAQKKMEEESVKLDNQLVEILDKQIDIQSVQKVSTPDHSLVRKVADEIVRIELNLSRMDKSIKGYKQLIKGVERIKDNYKSKGYEITDMLGKPYVEGMKVVANFISDETLPEGSQIITGIIKPQIIYNGTMIQAAEITVSQNI